MSKFPAYSSVPIPLVLMMMTTTTTTSHKICSSAAAAAATKRTQQTSKLSNLTTQSIFALNAKEVVNTRLAIGLSSDPDSNSVRKELRVQKRQKYYTAVKNRNDIRSKSKQQSGS